MFNSDARQDQFVSTILNNKKNGTYLDIGSCHSVISNNTYFLTSLNWKGICVEIDSSYNNSYNRENCLYLNKDAKNIDYSNVFFEFEMPSVIDYLSLDVDTLSVDVLMTIPIDEYRFKVITIEHDSYLYGDQFKKPQREILHNNGYFLLFGDVYVEQSGFDKKNCSFEDWWVDPREFDISYLNKIRSEKLYPSEIIKRLKNNN